MKGGTRPMERILCRKENTVRNSVMGMDILIQIEKREGGTF